jgi:hypothetical protein
MRMGANVPMHVYLPVYLREYGYAYIGVYVPVYPHPPTDLHQKPAPTTTMAP